METTNDNLEALITNLFQILGAQSENDENSDLTETRSKPIYQSVQILDSATSIGEIEKALLKEAALERETGLAALRKNDISTGKEKLQYSKDLISNQTISKEGTLIAATYQCAADAFLHLKNKDFQSAIQATQEATETHKDLFISFGHPIEQRRIHLARNIAKVLTLSGKQEQSLDMTIHLILYTIDEKIPWDFDFCKLENSNPIKVSEKYFVLNQLLSELGDLLSKGNLEKDLLIAKLNSLGNKLSVIQTNDFSIILDWVLTYKAFLQNDQVMFFKNGIQFFKKYSNQIPKGHNHLLMCLQEIIE